MKGVEKCRGRYKESEDGEGWESEREGLRERERGD